MSRILGLSFHPSQLVEVLMGGTPLLPQPTGSEVSWDPRSGGRDVLTLRDERGLSEVIWLPAGADRSWLAHAQSGLGYRRGRGARSTRHGGLSAASRGYEWQKLEGGNNAATPATASLRLPSVTYLEDPPRKSDVRLRWREREWNPLH